MPPKNGVYALLAFDAYQTLVIPKCFNYEKCNYRYYLREKCIRYIFAIFEKCYLVLFYYLEPFCEQRRSLSKHN